MTTFVTFIFSDCRDAGYPCIFLWHPVCDSDGKTHSSRQCFEEHQKCEASHGVYVQIVHEGECAEGPGSGPVNARPYQKASREKGHRRI